MKFLLDLQTLQSASRLRGVGRYCRGLAAALLNDFSGDASVLLNSGLGDDVRFDQIRQWVANCAPAGGIHAFRGLSCITACSPTHAERRRACALCYDAYVATLGVDIVHIASPFEGLADN